jgi:hypothetical protein
MTRELNKQWRDDQRPSFRNTPSNSRGDEQFSRPAHPRLSREVVDRAWKDGAQPHYSDYHPRTSNRPASPNGRNGQRSGYSSSQSRPGNNHFTGNRRDNAQRFERPFSNQQGPRSRSFADDRRYNDEQRFGERNDYNQSSYDRGNNKGHRPQQSQDYRQPRQNNSQFRGPRTGPERNDRYEHPRQGSNAPRGSRPFARNDRQGGPRRPSQNRSYQPHHEQFEGDYERFSNYHEPAPYHSRSQNRMHERAIYEQPTEPQRHVTPLPDGRVLKGSRPQQRKQAQFWTEVIDGTEELLQNVQTPATTPEPTIPEVTNIQPAQSQKSGRKKRATTSEKSGKRTASETTRKKNADAAKPHASGPRPSQRGFKWPTP